MSTTVISKLEPSDCQRNPSLFPEIPLHRPSENGTTTSMRELSSIWDVSQSGMPAEEEEEEMGSNCMLDLSMHSRTYELLQPAGYPAEESDPTSVSSSSETDRFQDAIEHPESSVLNMSASSESSCMSATAKNDNKPESVALPTIESKGDHLPESVAVCTTESKGDHIPESVSLLTTESSYLSATSKSDHIPESVPLDIANSPGNLLPDRVALCTTESKGDHIPEQVALCTTEKSEDTTGSLPIKVENVDYDSVAVEPPNPGLVSFKPENDTSEYENEITENVNNVSNVAESSNLINILDSPQNNAAPICASREDASEVINVSETDSDEVINVTSTTQESELARNPVSPEQEVVDVESYQPCVVDLTCEEEDDVDVVAVVEPVIFIGTGQGRRNRGHNNSPRVQVEDLAGTVQAPLDNAIEDANNNSNSNNNNDIVEDDRDHGELWRIMNPLEIDLQNPNLTFGSLLEQQEHIETVDDTQHQPPSPQRPVATARRTYRELRRSTRRQRRSRSRSPVLFPLIDYDDNQPHIANLVHAISDIMHEGRDWGMQLDAPNQLPLDANQAVAEEHHHRVVEIPRPKPPPSPPPVEQPTICCLVCLDSIATINSSSRSLCSTVCGHVFCSACIEEVVKQRKQCPVCRKRLTKRQYHPLFI